LVGAKISAPFSVINRVCGWRWEGERGCFFNRPRFLILHLHHAAAAAFFVFWCIYMRRERREGARVTRLIINYSSRQSDEFSTFPSTSSFSVCGARMRKTSSKPPSFHFFPSLVLHHARTKRLCVRGEQLSGAATTMFAVINYYALFPTFCHRPSAPVCA